MAEEGQLATQQESHAERQELVAQGHVKQYALVSQSPKGTDPEDDGNSTKYVCYAKHQIPQPAKSGLGCQTHQIGQLWDVDNLGRERTQKAKSRADESQVVAGRGNVSQTESRGAGDGLQSLLKTCFSRRQSPFKCH